MTERRGVLVMAYGTPRDLTEVEAYYTDIRRGRPPPPDLLADLIARYEAIGGRSPLLEITAAQAEGIADRAGAPAYVGFKHASPFIADAVASMAADRVDRAVGLVLAPHYSSMSVGDYEARARAAAADAGWTAPFEVVPSWHLEPGFVKLLAGRVSDALARLSDDARAGAVVVFSAHSLPRRIVSSGDPYPDQLTETAEAVAAAAGLDRFMVAWQSAGRTSEPWLGPDLLEVIDELAGARTRGLVVCPCGFVADHLEVLYDVDIETQQHAEGLGLELVRTASPNDDPEFLDVLASVVTAAFAR